MFATVFVGACATFAGLTFSAGVDALETTPEFDFCELATFEEFCRLATFAELTFGAGVDATLCPLAALVKLPTFPKLPTEELLAVARGAVDGATVVVRPDDADKFEFALVKP